MILKRSFLPVVNNDTRLLILGSLPGDQSLKQKQYYGHPQNRFWNLMAAVIGLDLLALEYQARLQTLLSYGIGLWDVVEQAKRNGSLDSHIRDHSPNDLAGMGNALPNLTTIAFNGATAARLGLKALGQSADSFHIVKLPSSSSAYTLSYSEKLEVWQRLSARLLS